VGVAVTFTIKAVIYAERCLQSVKLSGHGVGTAVDMLCFRDESNIFVWVDIMFDQYFFEFFKWMTVAQQHLVFIELNLLLFARIQYGDACAPIVG
jgi:hypothetical protein